ncbi:hypothetical protein JDS99_28405 [Bacillus cereus group sp. N6]|uniref:hypothetical protein n=1 Tax=Bacillus cereus group sp. N6 TaxID=2794583 RepID=UPI0018F733FD|nr:hypothetical protein [Bacillus cereus group sp. N6]MBJ8113475.1 hypothetical protein [Bacillus cereus group sp. N6]
MEKTTVLNGLFEVIQHNGNVLAKRQDGSLYVIHLGGDIIEFDIKVVLTSVIVKVRYEYKIYGEKYHESLYRLHSNGTISRSYLDDQTAFIGVNSVQDQLNGAEDYDYYRF